MKMLQIAFVQKMIFISLLLILSCKDVPKNTNLPDPNDSTANATLAREISKKIDVDPTNPENFFKRAEVYFNSKYLARAEADLQTAIQLDSLEDEYFFTLGRTQYAMNETKNAAQSYEKAILLNPNNKDARLKLADLYFVVKEHQKSLDLFNGLLMEDKTNPYLYHMLGMNFRETGDTGRAIYHFQTAIETDPMDYESTLYIASLCGAKNNKLALDYFNAAIKLRPKLVEPYFAKAVFLQQTENYASAMAEYKKVIKLDPTNIHVFYNVGYINYESGYLEKAMENWEVVTKLDPSYAKAWYMKGLLLEEKGDKNKALKNYKTALNLEPQNKLYLLAIGRVK
jgi:tetratricopeptide (TPR) repeat protein